MCVFHIHSGTRKGRASCFVRLVRPAFNRPATAHVPLAPAAWCMGVPSCSVLGVFSFGRLWTAVDDVHIHTAATSLSIDCKQHTSMSCWHTAHTHAQQHSSFCLEKPSQLRASAIHHPTPPKMCMFHAILIPFCLRRRPLGCGRCDPCCSTSRLRERFLTSAARLWTPSTW